MADTVKPVLVVSRNLPYVQIIGVQIQQINTAIQLPDMPIPNGMALVIKSWPTNTPAGLIFVATSRSGITNPIFAYPLQPGDFIAYFVQNANALYIAGNSALDIVALTAERDGG